MSPGVPRVPTRILLFLALFLAPLLGSLAVVTLGRTVWAARRERRRAAARERVRPGLLGRLGDGDPDWEGWVDGLDGTERSVLESVVETYLGRLRGEDADHLRALAGALGIPDREREGLTSPDRYRRLRAATWLALLSEPVDPDDLDGDDRDTRAAGARLLYEGDHPEAATAGTDLLLDAGEPLTVLGMDTLYQLNQVHPEPLLARGGDEYARWDSDLVIQVLEVLGECDPAGPGADVDWVLDCLDHDAERVRAAAPVALEGYGWRPDVRTAVAAATDDPSPLVRSAVYRTLAEWGDERSLDRLASALWSEPDRRCRLAAARVLVAEDRTPPSGVAAWSEVTGDRTWAWVSEAEAGPPEMEVYPEP